MVSTAFAQGKVTGTVIDGKGSLPGANIVIKGTKIAVSTDFDGKFSINTTANSGELVISFIGYKSKTVKFNGATSVGTVALVADDNQLQEIVVRSSVVDVAKDRKTPVAVSTIKAAEIQAKLGNQEFPEILANTPSVYASKSGGGFGDSRVTIRGFAQENIAVMINGVPVNDMEGSSVYWSNWAGLSDVTSAMQVQRGLGSSKLAISSVGGTINVLTKTSDMKEGGAISTGLGNNNYLKTQASYNTGVMKNGLSASVLLSRTTGDGYVNGTQFEGSNYFIALGYKANDKHDFQFTFTGAPQWHHQRGTAPTIAQYLASGNGEPNVKYNRDWGYLNGQEYNINRNFYHKPVASFNWDYKINEKTNLSAVIYGSWGRGGGSGAWGKANNLNFNDDRWRTGVNGIVNYDKIYAYNSGQTVSLPTNGNFTAFSNITRAKVNGQYENTAGSEATNGISQISGINSHNWYGGILNLNKKWNDFTFDLGIDYRTYKGIHVRYLNNLLGATTFKDVADINHPVLYTNDISSASPSLNPFANALGNTPIVRNYEGLVNWLGVFGQIEYSKDNLTAFLQGAISQQGFKRVDYFVYSNNDPLQSTGFKNIPGGNIKGGLNYNISEKSNVFINSGFYSKQSNFFGIYPNSRNYLNDNLTNEEVFGLEAGYGFRTTKFNANLNVYRTSWKNRFLSTSDRTTIPATTTLENPNGYFSFSGVSEIHQGVELDFNYKPIDKLVFNGMFSIGDWFYNGNASSTRFTVTNDLYGGGSKVMYWDKAKVGNSAQTTASIGATYEVVTRVKLDANYRYSEKLFASNSSSTGFERATNKGALELPSFGLVDAGFSYKLLVGKDKANSVNFRLNVNNLLNKTYIAESSSNYFASDFVTGTSGPTYASAGRTYNGVADANTVFFGFGRTWNFTLNYNF